jgi:hypothetical protein
VCRIARSARCEERFGKIAMHEGDARRNTATQRIGARNDQRFARDIGGNQAQRHRRFIGKRHGERTASSANFGGVEWMWCTAEGAISSNAVSEKGECGFNDQFTLRSRVENVGRHEQL